jgi:hypothetical protein
MCNQHTASIHRRWAYRILWKTEQQLLDRVDVVFLKLEPRPNNTLLKGQGLVGHKVIVDLLDLLGRLATILQRALDKVGLGQVRVDTLHRLDEQRVELLPRPLRTRSTLKKCTWQDVDQTHFDSVLNLVGEVLDGTRRRLFLRRVLRGRVGLCQMRDDNLSIALCAQGSRL